MEEIFIPLGKGLNTLVPINTSPPGQIISFEIVGEYVS